ncbi:MFS transporter [Planctomonas psychrotolerans]|uniref:MFS transporter n=1 Tax=Planctomonas psychrotolerans TaxID=2528712 RepID=UPI00123B543B|nr:MFS transporter [Planctomonas psychrotolerans]
MDAAPSLDLRAVQARTVRVLVLGQILGGLAIGSTLSIGAVLATEVSGSEAWAGAAATMSTLGAGLVAIPLARVASARGRRVSLTAGVLAAALGAVLTVVATMITSFPLLLLGFALLGSGAAVNLQSRFAATDVASAQHRGRDLSIVVWSATIGAVAGPNLFGPGAAIADALGMPPLTGSFVIAVVAQVLTALVFFVGLRPDPLLASRTLLATAPVVTEHGAVRVRSLVIFAIAVIGVSHAVMVSVMSMTPVHLVHHGAALTVIGLTISLHVAGMFALSPVFGWLSDRVGRVPTILLGQVLFAIALITVAVGSASTTLVTVGLVFLGLGWSASTVSGSALVADLVPGSARTRVQGRTDLVMNFSGAIGGATAGPVLALLGYSGLAGAAGVLVVASAVACLVLIFRAGSPATPPATRSTEASATTAT